MKRIMMAGVMAAFMLSGCSTMAPKEIRPTVTSLCGPHDEIAEALLKSYSESPIAIGMETAGSVIEVFASSKGSWTVILTTPAGFSCAMAGGENWEVLEKGDET